MGVYELLLIVQYCRDIRKAAHQLGLVGSGDELPRAKKKKKKSSLQPGTRICTKQMLGSLLILLD